MGAEQDVGVVLDEEGVLHVACGVILGEVEGGEDVPVVLHLGPFGDAETEPGEDVADLAADDGERVAGAEGDGVSRAGEVDHVGAIVGGVEARLQLIDLVLGRLFKLVKVLADLAFALRGHVAEVAHQGVDFAFLTEVFDA